jgi:uncharacterized protein YbjT (DUF2867 family)
MTDRKTIAVVGATGAQGGGLVRAIQSDQGSGFMARAITRNANSDNADALRQMGAEVVEADIDNPESVAEAFQGAYGAFCVTFFWEHFSPEKEKNQVANMVAAAKANRLQHVIWSTLEDTRKWVPIDDDRMPTLMERYKVPHFDAKGESDQLFTQSGVPTTFLLTSFYWDNLIHFGMGPKRGQDGKLVFSLPMGDKKLPGIAAEDIGKCAFGVFKEGEKFRDKTIGVAGEHLTGSEMAAALGQALGEEVQYFAISPNEYRGLGFPGAEDLGNMFQFKQEFESAFCGARDPETARILNPSVRTFESWLSDNARSIPID